MSPQSDQQDSRRKTVFALVIGLVIVGLGTMLLIGLLSGDDTDDTTEQPDSAQRFSGVATPAPTVTGPAA